MNRSHGPALRLPTIPLDRCPVCKGQAVILGIFHEMPCSHCHGSGWVEASTGEALPIETLVLQLGIHLRRSADHVAELRRTMPGRGPAEQYNQNNRRGAGGSNYTGD